MLLRRKIQASSLAEVVIAVSVIALCFGVVSLIFIRSTMVTTSYEEVRLQTEIQSALWEQLHNGQQEFDIEGVEVIIEQDELNDSLQIITCSALNEKQIWQQHQLKIE